MDYTLLKDMLVAKAKETIDNSDPSHDLQHCLRVLHNCETITKTEWWDMEILLPAALFHDVINYPKNDPRAKHASDESATWTKNLLESIPKYPKKKIPKVCYAIKHCSYSKNLSHDTLESKILQDADLLESVWAISIMRTFCSSGILQRTFFNSDDPFCTKREPEPLLYSFDLFPHRLLKVQDRILTNTGKRLAEQRTAFLHTFIKQAKKEVV